MAPTSSKPRLARLPSTWCAQEMIVSPPSYNRLLDWWLLILNNVIFFNDETPPPNPGYTKQEHWIVYTLWLTGQRGVGHLVSTQRASHVEMRHHFHHTTENSVPTRWAKSQTTIGTAHSWKPIIFRSETLLKGMKARRQNMWAASSSPLSRLLFAWLCFSSLSTTLLSA